ncbi:MAG: competence/damage-inducible protein A [Planctomycetota bacterium]
MLAIGNELLSGKVRDENLAYLAGELRPLGIELRLALVVPDEHQAIADALHFALARAELVLTSGGVGPTHDDITLEAVAGAFDLPVEPVPSLLAAIEAHYGERTNDELRSMALAPRGVELIQPVPFFLPVFKLGRVHVFPGDPAALRLLWNGFKGTLTGEPFHSARVELDLDEGDVAPHLTALCARHPEVAVGSYPRFDAGRPYKVLVTLDSRVRERVEAATAELITLLTTTFGRERVLACDGALGPARETGPVTR